MDEKEDEILELKNKLEIQMLETASGSGGVFSKEAA
jgi:hypothetical protein